MFKLVGLLVSLDVVKTETPAGMKISLENVTGTLLYNPHRSPLGRYVVVPFDMMTEAVLKDFARVYSRFSAYVKKDGAIAIEVPAHDAATGASILGEKTRERPAMDGADSTKQMLKRARS